MAQPKAESDSLLSMALRYAKKGWAVLPVESIVDGKCTCGDKGCRSAGKHPRTKHGVDDASIEVATIQGWWTEWPDASVGIACGDLSGLWALDVDAKAPKASGSLTGLEALNLLEEQHGRLPPTLEAATGGGGRHLFFSLPADRKLKNKVSIRGPKGEKTGLDVRSTGGYVVGPGSTLKNGCYVVGDERPTAVAPEWLVDLCQKPARAPVSPGERLGALPMGDRTSAALRRLQGAAGRVATAPEGKRNDTLNWAAHTVAESVAAGELSVHEVLAELGHAGARAGLDDLEIRATIYSGLGAGMGAVR